MPFRALRNAAGEPVGAYQFVYDVTERLREQAKLRETEAALLQAQKMDAVGQLTGGIAHDFNNLLQGVAGSLDLIRRRPGDEDKVKRWAEAGLAAAERGSRLTGQLLAFSRAQKIESRPVEVGTLIFEVRELLERTLGPSIEISIKAADPDAAVLTEPVQLEMAVLNLAINARDAMPEGGKLDISCRVVKVDSDPELDAGEYVELCLTDSGHGMTADIAGRAFDPFFTTKGVGKGTGLGLSQVYGIARQAGGTARIQSAQGVGTTVKLLLRRAFRDTALESAPAPDKADAASGNRKVLVIDDDPDVRRFLGDSLEALGYEVRVAESGVTGLNLFELESPDLVIVDFAMPGMNGAEVAKRLLAVRPSIPILVASGYSDTAALETNVGSDVMVLRKPFTIAQLQSAVRGLIAAADDGPS